MLQKSTLGLVALILVVVGALNWGLIGLGYLISTGSNWNVVYMLLGKWTMVEAVVYVLIGLAGVYKLVACSKGCDCGASRPM